MNDKLKTGFAVIVGAGWVFNLVAPAFLHSYHSNLAVNAPMMLLLGSLWASKKGKDD